MTIKNILKEINKVLKINNINPNFKTWLIFLSKIYEEFSKETIIVDYTVINKHHSLSIKKENTDFITIDMTKDLIELRFLRCEQMFFIEEIDELFLEKILTDFFKGNYVVIIDFNKYMNSVFKEIKWNDNELNMFNEKYKVSVF